MNSTEKFDSFFNELIVDSNNISVSDINKGLMKLYTYFNENDNTFGEIQRYLVSNHEQDYPELIAQHSAFGDTKYWWWLLLLNRLEDPFVDIKENWIYSINSSEQVTNFINNANTDNSSKEETRLGTVIELN